MLDRDGQMFIFGKELTGQEKTMLKQHPLVDKHWDRVYQIRKIMKDEGVTQEIAEKRVKHDG